MSREEKIKLCKEYIKGSWVDTPMARQLIENSSDEDLDLQLRLYEKDQIIDQQEADKEFEAMCKRCFTEDDRCFSNI